uniref:Uncharacterized protein n=1 Tax=Anopheles atroparvus TaxID=41427 RepID=A0AAG5DRP5_ANOAO
SEVISLTITQFLFPELVYSEHDDAANVIIEELPFLYVLEDDEGCLDSDDEDDSREEKREAFKDGLRNWALRNKITHHALNELLVLIRETTDFVLPKDSKTFLKTPVDVGKELECVAGGKLWYQGIQKSLQYYYREVTPTVNIFHLNFSMDGIPLHNSGPTQLWPISMQLFNVSESPVLIVAVYCGPSKPDNAEGYLRSFQAELNFVQEQGVLINGKQVDIKVRAFLADSPARAFIK